MDYLILRRVVGGVLLGAALFFAPFFMLKLFAFFMIAGLFLWAFRGKGHYRHRRWATAHPDHIRSMSNEEYEQFKNSYNHGCRGRDSKSDETPKTQ